MLSPWLLICFAIFLIGLTKSGLGAGMGLIVVPLTALGLGHTSRGSEAALGLLLPLLIAGDLMSVWQYRRVFSFQLVKPLMLPTAIGIGLGSGLLYLIHQQNAQLIGTLMRLEIGLESVVLVGLSWWREFRGLQHKLLPEPLRSWLSGLFTGVSTTLAHAAGPVVAMYLLPLKPQRQVFVGSAAVFFFLANTAKLPTYILAGQFAKAEPSFIVKFLPLVVAGALVGFYLVRRMTDSGYLKLINVATFVIGVYLVIESTMKFV
ncbi:MAG: sulfite exporter TauE/SafE family protein [Tepidisphaeraceae bacterium]